MQTLNVKRLVLTKETLNTLIAIAAQEHWGTRTCNSCNGCNSREEFGTCNCTYV